MSRRLHPGETLELADMQHNMAYYKQKHPVLTSTDDHTQKQTDPRSSDSSTFLPGHDTYHPLQPEYHTGQMLNSPRGQMVSNNEPNFEPVARQTQASVKFNLVDWDPRDHNRLLSSVYKDHDLRVDEPIPNRPGMSLSRLPLFRHRGRGANQRGLGQTRYGSRRKFPVLGSSHFTNRGHRMAPIMTHGPSFNRLVPRVRFPGHLAPSLHRNVNVKHYVQGNHAVVG